MGDVYDPGISTNLIRQEALRLGFLDIGFSRATIASAAVDPLTNWLKQGHQAGMDYMNRNMEKRLDPTLLVEGARSVISLLNNYYSPEVFPNTSLRIAKYAYGQDYHEVIKSKLRVLDQFITERFGIQNQRVFTDSAPVLERYWAQNSGLGWIGKSSCLISRKYGSFFFISEIITSLELEYDEPLNDYCGSCRKCIDACPTQAITEYRSVNSHRCISYQTIENRSEIPVSLKGKFSGFIFGCDICQDVCPWNKKAHPHAEPLFLLKEDLRIMTDQQWQTLDEPTYQKIFQKSAVKRAKYPGLKRNVEFVEQDQIKVNKNC